MIAIIWALVALVVLLAYGSSSVAIALNG